MGMLLNGTNKNGKTIQPVSNTGLVTIRDVLSQIILQDDTVCRTVYIYIFFFLMYNYPRNLHTLF